MEIAKIILFAKTYTGDLKSMIKEIQESFVKEKVRIGEIYKDDLVVKYRAWLTF